MLDALTHWIENTLNCRIYRKSIPHGTDMYLDINKHFGLKNIKTIMDVVVRQGSTLMYGRYLLRPSYSLICHRVQQAEPLQCTSTYYLDGLVGANVGQSALVYLEHFSEATIYSFEPVPATYQALEKAVKNHSRIRPVCCGMGRQIGNVSININPLHTMSSILHARPDDYSEMIVLDSLSHFCEDHQIGTIDFLKIDTEGYEFEVLEGGLTLLENSRIRLILVECEPIAKSNYFVAFAQLADFLSRFDYEIFGIYEQQPDWNGRRSIQYFNAMFVSKESASPPNDCL